MAEVDGLSYNMAAASLEALITYVTQALVNHDVVRLRDFGKFGVRQRRTRQGTHPQTHQPIQIASMHVPYFTPSPRLKRSVNNDSKICHERRTPD